MRSGSGTWRVADNGTDCATIKWSAKSTEDWCRHIFKEDDKYYGFGKLEENAHANEFGFSK